MAFKMSAEIKVEKYKPFKPSSLKWKRHVDNYSDYGLLKIPAIAVLKTNSQYEKTQTGLQFTEGQKIEFHCGYNGFNKLRFKGFIRRINFSVPLEIECEGYSYQLRKKLDITKTYANTTVKKILQDLVAGTDIVLSSSIPNVPIPKAVFKHCTGTQILDFLKDKCLLSVYFNFDVLYVGLLETKPANKVKFRLGWNVIKDNDLKFNDKKEFAQVRIKLVKRQKDGTTKNSFYGAKDGQVVEKRISLIDDEATLQKIAEREKARLTNRGYEGKITAFLEPIVGVGDSILIEDPKYQERKGSYFSTGIDGEFSTGGGRQIIYIGNSLGGG